MIEKMETIKDNPLEACGWGTFHVVSDCNCIKISVQLLVSVNTRTDLFSAHLFPVVPKEERGFWTCL